MPDSILQVDQITDKAATTNKELATYASGNWSWGAGIPAGSCIQLLQYYKTDRDSIAGAAQGSGTGKNSFAFIPGQGSDAVFQQAITTTGSNKVLITHHGCYAAGAKDFILMFQIFRGAAADTAVGSCTKLGAGADVGNTNQTQCNTSTQTTSAGGTRIVSFSYLDSPGAGTHYYKLGWLGEHNQTYYTGRTANDSNVAYHASTTSSLTVMEIQA